MRLGGTSLRVLLLIGPLAGLVMSCGLTSTVETGNFEGVRDLQLDENFYYCVVQPQVITAQRCSPGGAGDPAGGCHSSKSSMILADITTPVACTGTRPTGVVSQAERSNYQAAQLRVTRDPSTAPLITRPTAQQSHPREIFKVDPKKIYGPCAPGGTDSCSNIITAWIGGAR